MSQYNFQIGERTKPMELEAKIYIEDNGLEHPYVGNRFHKLHLHLHFHWGQWFGEHPYVENKFK